DRAGTASADCGRSAGDRRHGSRDHRADQAAQGRSCGGGLPDRAAVSGGTQGPARRRGRLAHPGVKRPILSGMKAAHIEWTPRHTLRMLDQTRLPNEEHWVEARTYQEAADAIKTMVVRGAPLIGVAAAFGMAMAAQQSIDELPLAAKMLRATRPTAVNLSWALERMLGFAA